MNLLCRLGIHKRPHVYRVWDKDFGLYQIIEWRCWRCLRIFKGYLGDRLMRGQ